MQIGKYRTGRGNGMALTDTFIRNAKTTKPAGQKHADGGGLYLLVTTAGKYWRVEHRETRGCA
jgi:hypothetical protein